MTGIRVHQPKPLQAIDFRTQFFDEWRKRVALSPVPISRFLACCGCRNNERIRRHEIVTIRRRVMRDENDFFDTVRNEFARFGDYRIDRFRTMRAFDCRDDAKRTRPITAIGDFLYRLGLGKKPDPFSITIRVREMLEALYPVFPLSIVSARGGRTIQIFLKQFHLEEFFRCVATSQTCRHTKPYPDPILWAAKQMGVPPENCLMIGDTTVDIQAGKAAGAQTVAVLCGFGTRDELHSAGADLFKRLHN